MRSFPIPLQTYRYFTQVHSRALESSNQKNVELLRANGIAPQVPGAKDHSHEVEDPEVPGPSGAKRKRVKSEALSDEEDDEEDEKSLEVGPADVFHVNIRLTPTVGATCFTSGPPGEKACQEGERSGQARDVAHPRPNCVRRRSNRLDQLALKWCWLRLKTYQTSPRHRFLTSPDT